MCNLPERKAEKQVGQAVRTASKAIQLYNGRMVCHKAEE